MALGKTPVPHAAFGRKISLQKREMKKKNMAQREYMRHFHLELTPEQYQMLSEKAKRCGVTKRTFLIRMMEGKELRDRPSQEIKNLRTEIHQIGNNINQIARSVNAGIANAEDANRALRTLDQVYELMYEIAKK